MSRVRSEHLALGKGRQRPGYQPRSLQCPQCGGGLEVKDERAQLQVCPYCAAHLELDPSEAKVLQRGGAGHKLDFPLELGDDFQWTGARYEVIARMAFIEDGDPSELTRQYYLYNPYQGTLWLDEYQGHWSLSHPTHVMPRGQPLALDRGGRIETHDGRKWVLEESGEYELVYVDGSLPWVAQVGDRTAYSELVAADGSGEQFGVQRSHDETEYDRGRSLPVALVRKATGKPDLPGAEREQLDAARVDRLYRRALKIMGAAVALNLLLMIITLASGDTVLKQAFTAEQLSQETFSESFMVEKPDSLVKVKANVPELDNAWMSLDVALVRTSTPAEAPEADPEMVVHAFDEEISYYHGTEGGESWSEGSRGASTYVRVKEPGSYRLLLRAASHHGYNDSSDQARHGLRVKVISGAMLPGWFIFSSVVCGLLLIPVSLSYARFRGWIKSEDDD